MFAYIAPQNLIVSYDLQIHMKGLRIDATGGDWVLYILAYRRLTCDILPHRMKEPEQIRVLNRRQSMRLNLIFVLIDFLIILAYPFVFIADKVRQLLKIKR